MEKEYYLELSLKNDFTATQGICFPLAVILSNSKLENWYYMNYMLPIARIDGITYLICKIADSYVYGADATIFSKIMRFSNMSVEDCSYISDINTVLQKKIDKQQYCVLFLDFYYLKSSEHYHINHFAHEVMIYGYSQIKRTFRCFGYINGILGVFDIDSFELNRAYKSSFKYIMETNGWAEYMFMQFQLVEHKEVYPYSAETFINKIQQYLSGNINEQCYYEELLYLNAGEDNRYGFGINVTDVFVEYIQRLCANERNLDEPVQNAFISFQMYRDYHKALYNHILYFINIIDKETAFSHLVNRYKEEVVDRCEVIRMLYLKLGIMQEREQSLTKTLLKLKTNLELVHKFEKEILSDFLDLCYEL